MNSSKRDVMLSTRILAKIRNHTIENKIKSKQLENEFQITGGELREIIHTLRESGEPIGSDNDGYFYARSYNEIESTCGHIRSRAMSMLGIVKKITERFNGQQQSIFEM